MFTDPIFSEGFEGYIERTSAVLQKKKIDAQRGALGISRFWQRFAAALLYKSKHISFVVMTVGKVLLASLRPIPNIRGDNSEILMFRGNFWSGQRA